MPEIQSDIAPVSLKLEIHLALLIYQTLVHHAHDQGSTKGFHQLGQQDPRRYCRQLNIYWSMKEPVSYACHAWLAQSAEIIIISIDCRNLA